MRSVRTKLTLQNIAILIVVLAVMGGALRLRIQANLLDEVDRDLALSVGSVHTSEAGRPQISKIKGPSGLTLFNSKIQRQGIVEVLRRNQSEVRLEAAQALPRLIPVGVGQDLASAIDPQAVVLAERGARTFHDFTKSGEEMRSLSIPFSQSGHVFAVAQVARSLAPMNQQIADITAAMMMLLPLAMILAAGTGALLVRSAMRPLKRLTDSARELEENLSGKRLPVHGSDEFSELANAFNDALDRTAMAFKIQQRAMSQLERFTGDAAHELRTPLASIKGSASYLIHMTELPPNCTESVASIDRSSDRMIKLIDDLLLLARRDSGCPLEIQDHVELATLIHEALEELTIPNHVSLSVDINPSLTARLDPGTFKRAICNVVSNAFVHARSRVRIKGSFANEYISVSVSDDGNGIAPEHLERLGERFYSVESSRSRQFGGTGLGLAIAKSVCAGHGGSLQISSEVGVNTTVTIILPSLLLEASTQQ